MELILRTLQANGRLMWLHQVHTTQCHGLVERNVQTIKQLLKKADESKQDAFIALLEFCNSPISGMEESPAELPMSRKLKTPTYLLEPMPRPTSQVCQQLLSCQWSLINTFKFLRQQVVCTEDFQYTIKARHMKLSTFRVHCSWYKTVVCF